MFGCYKSKLDRRDVLLAPYLKKEKIPHTYDITHKMTPVKNQGKEGSCTGFAGVGMKEYQEQIDYGEYVELAERFLYNEAKKKYWGRNWQSKQGADLRSVVKVLKELGVCEERFYPYIPGDTDLHLPGAYINSQKYKIKSYARITNLRELKHSIYQYGPVIIGFRVFKSIRKTGGDGIVPTPNMMLPSNWRSLGGHAVVVCGYNDDLELVKFKNSWGEDWGFHGYGFLSYEYIKRHLLDAFSTVDIDDPHPRTVEDLLVENDISKRWL